MSQDPAASEAARQANESDLKAWRDFMDLPVTSTAARSACSPWPLPSDDRRLVLADERQEPAASAPGSAGLLVRTLGALLLIIGLIVAAAWALKRMGGARFGAPREDAPELTVLA